MQRHPGATEELVEDVVLLTVAVEETSADDMHLAADVLLGKGEGRLLQLLQWEVLGQRGPRLTISVGVGLVTGHRLAPGHRRADDDERLVLVAGCVRILQRLEDGLRLVKVRVELGEVQDDEVGIAHLFDEGLRLFLVVDDLDGVRGTWTDEAASGHLVQSTEEAVRRLILLNAHVVVAQLLKQALAEQRVDAGEEESLGRLDVAHSVLFDDFGLGCPRREHADRRLLREANGRFICRVFGRRG